MLFALVAVRARWLNDGRVFRAFLLVLGCLCVLRRHLARFAAVVRLAGRVRRHGLPGRGLPDRPALRLPRPDRPAVAHDQRPDHRPDPVPQYPFHWRRCRVLPVRRRHAVRAADGVSTSVGSPLGPRLLPGLHVPGAVRVRRLRDRRRPAVPGARLARPGRAERDAAVQDAVPRPRLRRPSHGRDSTSRCSIWKRRWPRTWSGRRRSTRRWHRAWLPRCRVLAGGAAFGDIADPEAEAGGPVDRFEDENRILPGKDLRPVAAQTAAGKLLVVTGRRSSAPCRQVPTSRSRDQVAKKPMVVIVARPAAASGPRRGRSWCCPSWKPDSPRRDPVPVPRAAHHRGFRRHVRGGVLRPQPAPTGRDDAGATIAGRR